MLIICVRTRTFKDNATCIYNVDKPQKRSPPPVGEVWYHSDRSSRVFPAIFPESSAYRRVQQVESSKLPGTIKAKCVLWGGGYELIKQYVQLDVFAYKLTLKDPGLNLSRIYPIVTLKGMSLNVNNVVINPNRHSSPLTIYSQNPVHAIGLKIMIKLSTLA